MGERLVNYDSRKVSLVLAGLNIEDGRAAGSFVKVSPNGATFEVVAGADGHIARYYVAGSMLRKFEVTLLATSKHNQQLSILHALDVNSRNGSGIGPFLLKDNNGTTLIATDKCFITQAPDLEFGEEVKELTWQGYLIVPHDAAIIGGN